MPSRSKPTSARHFALDSEMADKHFYTDFVPSSEWTQDPKNHELRIYLPGFRKDEFRVQIDDRRKLTVKGRRSLGDGKFMHLEQVFAVPEDSDIDNIKGKFDGGCLSLFMPKVVIGTEVPQKKAASSEEPKSEETNQKETAKEGEETKPRSEEPNQKHKMTGFFVAAVVAAFSAGFYVYQKLKPNFPI